MQGSRFTRPLVVVVRLDVGRTTRQQQAIEVGEKLGDLERLRQHGHEQRQGTRGTRHRMRVLLPDHVKRVGTDHATIGRNSNDGPQRHTREADAKMHTATALDHRSGLKGSEIN